MKELKFGKLIITTQKVLEGTIVLIPCIALYFNKNTRDKAICISWLKFCIQIGTF